MYQTAKYLLQIKKKNPYSVAQKCIKDKEWLSVSMCPVRTDSWDTINNLLIKIW